MDIVSVSSGLPGLLSDTGTAASDKRLTLTVSQSETGDSGSLAQSLNVSNDTAASFADAIMDKIAAATASNAGAGLSAAGTDLEKSLTDTVDYMRDNFGDAAAKTVMGLIAKGVGDGQGGENAMGGALLSALQFIDNQFGVAAGDKAISYFNGALNDAVNAYYQNGHNEVFYASDGTLGASQLTDSLSASLSAVADRYGQDAASMVSDIIDKSLSQTGLTREGLSTALGAASDYLNEHYGAADLTAGTSLPTSLERGSVLDMTV
jgi:hypothetical protein